MRFDGNYIEVPDGSFEFDFYTTIRRVLFRKYFTGFRNIIEFGCGTGTNLVILSEILPEASLVGCDWASSSQEILKIMAKELKAKVHGVRMNMLTLEGSENVEIDSHNFKPTKFLNNYNLSKYEIMYKNINNIPLLHKVAIMASPKQFFSPRGLLFTMFLHLL